MATIKFGQRGAARSVTQVGGTGSKPGALDPFMEKCTVTTGKVYRALPPYACDTWEVYITLGSQDPMVRVFGLDDDYSGSGAPAAGTKFELNIKDNYTSGSGGGFDMAALSVQTIIVDQAWKGLMFEVEEKDPAGDAGTATIKVKAYRSGQCTFEGTFATGTEESS